MQSKEEGRVSARCRYPVLTSTVNPSCMGRSYTGKSRGAGELGGCKTLRECVRHTCTHNMHTPEVTSAGGPRPCIQ